MFPDFINLSNVLEVATSIEREFPTLSGMDSRDATRIWLLPPFERYTFTDLKTPILVSEPTESVALETLMSFTFAPEPVN